MTQNDDRRDVPVKSDAETTDSAPELTNVKPTSGELTNVDLQFMGRPSAHEQIEAEVAASSHESGKYREHGMDKQDVAVEQTMDASDPPSTNMGDADRD